MTTDTSTNALVRLSTIKGTALNKGKARTWIETGKLAQYGFVRHAPIRVIFGDTSIGIILDDTGNREVAGRVRNGKEIQILDLCEPLADRNARFNGSEKLEVLVSFGLIVIRALEV